MTSVNAPSPLQGRSMRLLVVAPLLYHEHCGNGGGVICARLLQGLAARHQVSFIGFGSADAAEQASAVTALSAMCIHVKAVPLPATGRLTWWRWQVAQLLGGPPVDARIFDRPAMHRAVREAVQSFEPEAVLLQFPYMAQYLSDCGNRPAIVDVQDVFYISRLRDYAAPRPHVARLKRLVAWIAWTRYELFWYRRSSALMVLSDEDRAALHALVPGVPAFTNMAAIAPRAMATHLAPRELQVGFSGNFGHPPNVDALNWLSTELAPRLAQACPGVRIVVAGRGLSDAQRASLHASIQMQGFVEDYDQFMAACQLFLAPMRFGGGVKIKVLESLACGRPVVTTPIGAEGIPLGPAEGLQVARTGDELVALTVALLHEPAAGLAAAARGAQAVQALFGLDGKVRRIEQELARLLAASVTAESRFGGEAV